MTARKPDAARARPPTRAPHQGAHHRVGGVLGDRLHHGPGDPGGVQRLRVPPAQVRQPRPRGRQVAGLQGGPDGPRLTGQRGPAEHRPGGSRGQGGGQRGAGAYRATGQQGGARGATGAQRGERRAGDPVVAPQPALQGARRAPERRDRMAAPRIAREEVAEEAERGAVREHAIGTHRLNRPSCSGGTAGRVRSPGGPAGWAPGMAEVLTQGPRPGST